jgi:hypothetical protein
MPGAIVNTQANQQSQPSLRASTGPSVNTFQYKELTMGASTFEPTPRFVTPTGWVFTGTLTNDDGNAWLFPVPGVGVGAGQGIVIIITLPTDTNINYENTLVDINATGIGEITPGLTGSGTGAITCSFDSDGKLRIRLSPNLTYDGGGNERVTLPSYLWVKCTNVT